MKILKKCSDLCALLDIAKFVSQYQLFHNEKKLADLCALLGIVKYVSQYQLFYNEKKLADLCALLGIVEASVCDGGVATYGPGSANIIFVIFVKDNFLVILYYLLV